jgi:hypothetical protein
MDRYKNMRKEKHEKQYKKRWLKFTFFDRKI